VTLKDWSEPLVNIQHLAATLKDTLNENRIYHAEGVVKQMLTELMHIHAAIMIAQWEEDQMDRVRAKAKTSPVFGATK
jgi:hypothetical protein